MPAHRRYGHRDLIDDSDHALDAILLAENFLAEQRRVQVRTAEAESREFPLRRVCFAHDERHHVIAIIRSVIGCLLRVLCK